MHSKIFAILTLCSTQAFAMKHYPKEIEFRVSPGAAPERAQLSDIWPTIVCDASSLRCATPSILNEGIPESPLQFRGNSHEFYTLDGTAYCGVDTYFPKQQDLRCFAGEKKVTIRYAGLVLTLTEIGDATHAEIEIGGPGDAGYYHGCGRVLSVHE